MGKEKNREGSNATMYKYLMFGVPLALQIISFLIMVFNFGKKRKKNRIIVYVSAVIVIAMLVAVNIVDKYIF